jgi:hypothetical protein
MMSMPTGSSLASPLASSGNAALGASSLLLASVSKSFEQKAAREESVQKRNEKQSALKYLKYSRFIQEANHETFLALLN